MTVQIALSTGHRWAPSTCSYAFMMFARQLWLNIPRTHLVPQQGLLLALLVVWTISQQMLRQISACVGALPKHNLCHMQAVGVIGMVAYLSYLVGDYIGLSGIVCLFCCSVTMSHYAMHNITKAQRAGTMSAFETLSFLSEGAIFVYVGLDALDPMKWKVRMHLLHNSASMLCITTLWYIFGQCSINRLSLHITSHSTCIDILDMGAIRHTQNVMDYLQKPACVPLMLTL